LKVETDIIASITTSPTGLAGILVIMYVEIFNIFFNFQYQSQFLRMRVTNWPNIFVDQGHFSDSDFISGTHQRENVQFADNYRITAVLKVETDIITNITASLIGRPAMLAIMYVETLWCYCIYWLRLKIFVITLTDNFQY
jgi:hypothetical protein